MPSWCIAETPTSCACLPRSTCRTFTCYTTIPTCGTNNSTCPSQSDCGGSSKFAQFCNGTGSLSRKESDKKCSRPLSPCCMLANPNPNPQPRNSCKPILKSRPLCNVPPAIILNDSKQNSPTNRLQAVDIHEELCYYSKREKCPPFDCYSVCNDCGGMDYVPGCCPPMCCDDDEPSEPVKYTRRQHFNFSNPKKDWVNEACRPANKFDEFPVGKNPTPSQTRFDPSECGYPEIAVTYSDESLDCPCRKQKCKKHKNNCKHDPGNLKTGLYYYSKTNKCFLPESQMPKKQPVIQVTENSNPPCACPPKAPKCPPKPAACPTPPQPMMPYANPFYGCFNPCNPYFNPCMNMFNPCNPYMQFNACNNPWMGGCGMTNFGGMGCLGGMPMGGGCGPCVIPMCIPSCGQYAGPQQPPPPPPPVIPKQRKKKKSSTTVSSSSSSSGSSSTSTPPPKRKKKKKSLYTSAPAPTTVISTEVTVMSAETEPVAAAEEEEEEEKEEEEEYEFDEPKEEEEEEEPECDDEEEEPEAEEEEEPPEVDPYIPNRMDPTKNPSKYF